MASKAAEGCTRTCPRCREETIFVAEAFGCVCTSCGTLFDEEPDLTWESGFQAYQPSTISTIRPLNRTQQAAARQLSALSSSSEWQQIELHISTIVSGTLAHFHQLTLQRQVYDLIRQVQTLSSAYLERNDPKRNLIRGEQGASRLAIAATFSVLKAKSEHVSLQDVTHVTGDRASREGVAETLRYIEFLIGGSELLTEARDDPSYFLSAHLTFLSQQLAPKAQVRAPIDSPQRAEENNSIFERKEIAFIREARVQSTAFHELAHSLCKLCSDNGLTNRSSKTYSKKDLSTAAWAIAILAMESSCGRPCNEGKMARAVVYRNADITPASAEAMVKKRYVEVSRMLTLYLEQLPWLSELRPAAKRERRPKKARGREKVSDVKAHLSSISPLPRPLVAKYLTDVLKLRRFIEKKLALIASFESSLESLHWSAFGSTEDFFHPIRASAEGRSRIMEEEREYRLRSRSEVEETDETTEEMSPTAPATIFDSIRLLSLEAAGPETDSHSSLASSIGSDLLTYEALGGMSEEVIDSLLFEEGEMDSYLRGEEERQVIKSLRIDSGEWDTLTSPIRIKRASPSPLHERSTPKKKTKALPDDEVARILSQL